MLHCQSESDQQNIQSNNHNNLNEKLLNLSTPSENGKAPRPECIILKDIGVNDLGVNDVVVRSATSSLVCIKARFSLAIKVEALLEHYNKDDPFSGRDGHNKNDLILLGYLPLDSVVSVDDNCYEPLTEKKSSPTSNGNQKDELNRQTSLPSLAKEPELTIEFVCGKLTFTFHKDDEHYSVSSIKGVVNLGNLTEDIL